MGKQLIYYADKQLSLEIRALAQTLALKIISQDGRTKDIQFYDNIAEAVDYNIYFYDDSIGNLIFNPNNGLIDDNASPVIQVCQTYISEEKRIVYRGRLWISTFYYSADGNKIFQSKTLDDDYKKLVSFIKKRTVYRNIFKGSNCDVQSKSYVSDSLLELLNGSPYRFM